MVCLDSMGQDRQLTDEERARVLSVIKDFSDSWTKLENDNLSSDITRRFKIHEEEKDLIDTEDAPTNRFEDEENQYINDFFADQDGEEPLDEDSRNDQTPPLKRKWITQKVASDEFKKAILDFKNFKVIKYSRFFQSLFYFLGYSREDICEEGTNNLTWKKAKHLINADFYEKLEKYSPVGCKDSEFKKYQLINFIETSIDGLGIEEIEQYSWYLSKLFKWMQTMIEHRKEDIVKRKDIKQHMREIREEKEKEFKEREDQKETRQKEAIEEFEIKVDLDITEKLA